MKLSPWTLIIIGAAVAVIALSYGLFQHWMPNMTEAGYWQQNAEALQAEADKMGQAQKRKELAQKLVDEEAAKWQLIVEQKTPPQSVAAGGIDLAVNRWQLTVDAQKFRNNIQRAINRQIKLGGVLVVSGPEVPRPGDSAGSIVADYFNYPAIAFPVCIFDLGTVTVQGTSEQIYRNMEAWSDMPEYLAVADGLRLSGTAPVLTGTYALTVVAYIRGSEISAPVPEEGSAPGGAPPGGGGGGGGGALPPGPSKSGAGF